MAAFRLILTLMTISSTALSQSAYNGLIVTNQDSVVRGYMRISLDGQRGKKIEITQDKKKKPLVFFTDELKYYAFKKDTFILLDAFRPFQGEEYLAQGVEAKVLIRKGKVKLYKGALPGYVTPYDVEVASKANGPSNSAGNLTLYRKYSDYETFILKDYNGELLAVHNPGIENFLRRSLTKENNFFKSMERVFGDDENLMERIRLKELKYSDIPEIVRIYNSKH